MHVGRLEVGRTWTRGGPRAGAWLSGAMTTQRHLAAILACDVVGYSRLTERDERGTLERLKIYRKDLLEPLVSEHQGRIVKLTGDGMLCEFASVVNAVTSAMAIQQALAEHEAETPEEERIRFRIGVNLGDVVCEEDGDLYGDGVNIAARLESIADPGAVVVSGTAYDHLQGKLDCGFTPLGDLRLKNIERPVRAYRVETDASASVAAPPPLPEKPSIAVLPFTNMSGDPEQEYFADGLVEDIITALEPGELLLRDRPQLVLHLQGPGGGRAPGRRASSASATCSKAASAKQDRGCASSGSWSTRSADTMSGPTASTAT